MLVYVFLDLDDTLFQTLRKCPAGSPLHVAAHARDGTPLSFMTEKQRALLNWLARDACVIPTTARNHDAFRRLALSFDGMAILDFGGVILDRAGEIDRRWDREIREQVGAARAALHQIHRAILDISAQERLRVRSRIIGDFDMDLYVVVKGRDATAGERNVPANEPDGTANDLHQLYDSVRHFDNDLFYLHFNDNNLAVIPRCLNKRLAVQYLIDTRLRAGSDDMLTIGVGDSATDLGFMAACDYSLAPQNSQIARALLRMRDV